MNKEFEGFKLIIDEEIGQRWTNYMMHMKNNPSDIQKQIH
jgi:hypothetical protein